MNGWRVGIVAAAACCAVLAAPGQALAQETVRITEAGFSPNVLGAPTNAFGSATIGSTTFPVPSPIRHIDVYGPAGLTLNLEGSQTCVQEALEREGTKACPANSRAGTGGGEGVYELAHEIIKEPYTLEFFLTDNQPGHVALVIFLEGSDPVSIEIYLPATGDPRAPSPTGSASASKCRSSTSCPKPRRPPPPARS